MLALALLPSCWYMQARRGRKGLTVNILLHILSKIPPSAFPLPAAITFHRAIPLPLFSSRVSICEIAYPYSSPYFIEVVTPGFTNSREKKNCGETGNVLLRRQSWGIKVRSGEKFPYVPFPTIPVPKKMTGSGFETLNCLPSLFLPRAWECLPWKRGSYREVEYLMFSRDMELTSSSVQLLISFPKKILLPLTCQPTNPFPKRRSDEYSYSLPPLF